MSNQLAYNDWLASQIQKQKNKISQMERTKYEYPPAQEMHEFSIAMEQLQLTFLQLTLVREKERIDFHNE